MTSRIPIALVLIAAVTTAGPAAGAAACEVRSGPTTAALVELYTSEGCSSCPPADVQLRKLRDAAGPNAMVVPLALHVDYWDNIGWKDPFARRAFSARQTWLVRLNQHGVVYTPHFFVGGTELGSWQGGLGAAVARQNARPARADIHLTVSATASNGLFVDAEANAHGGAGTSVLYLAVTESGLESKVTRGENAGATLAHDHVVREWIGPLRLTGGTIHAQREIALPPTWNRARLRVAAFVENDKTGEVLQAVSAGSCVGS